MEVKSKPPEWDLSDLYSGISDSNIVGDLTLIASKTKIFVNTYQGNVCNLGNDQFYKAIKEYESINALSIKVGSFSELMRLIKIGDPTVLIFWQNTSEELNKLSSSLTFFELEISAIGSRQYSQYLTSLSLNFYKKWFDKLRISQPFLLDAEMEIFLRTML